MSVAAFLDSVAPTLTVRTISPLAKLGWRKREAQPLSGPDALSEPVKAPELDGDLASRPSVTRKLRDLTRAGH